MRGIDGTTWWVQARLFILLLHVLSIRVLGLVDQMVHVLISVLIRKFQLIVEDLRVVDPKSAILAPLPDDLVDQVEFIFSDGRVLILFHDQL